ncbi:MAG: glycosyltransferase family 4 protein [Firmicutes bacterium]|nr:glycosyltransferase family 4 protein [Bacillota bacterium]
MKILFITLEYDKAIAGGAGRAVNRLAQYIGAKTTLHVMLIQNKLYYLKWIGLYRMGNHEWVRQSYVWLRFERIIHLIRREKYDAVHIFHAGYNNARITGIIKKEFPQLKIIYSCHSIIKYERNIRFNRPNMLEYENFIVNHSDHIHFLNQSSLKYFEESYALEGRQSSYSLIPNGIAEDDFQGKDADFGRKLEQLLKKDGKITVLCMSRWSWGKGLEYFLDAVPQVTARYPNIQFVVAGRKSRSWEYKYKEYLRFINQKIAALSGYVIPLGWLNNGQRNALFGFADIWVMPSLLEYFPYSILEPMIAKIPIISSRIDCVLEILRDKEECLFYEPNSPEQLADQILSLVYNAELRRKLAEKAYQKAKELYHWERVGARYLEMYQTVIAGK